jgi:hypothetical protein
MDAPTVSLSDILPPTPPEEIVPEVDGSIWEEDNELTENFRQLANTEPRALGEDVEVIPLQNYIFVDTNASPHLVTRVEQRKVVDYAFKVSRDNLSKRRVTIAVRGSPGIGKSWSGLLYIRKLLNQSTGRRPIIFEHGEPGIRMTYLIMPPDGDEAWVAHRLKPNMDVPREWIECGIIDLVVDPAQFGEWETPGPSRLVASMGHCFIPASPDDRHLGGARKDSSLLVQLVFGPWVLKQLQKGFPYMVFRDPVFAYNKSHQDYTATMETMVDNYYVLGGLSRYLVESKANSRKAEITPEAATLHAQYLLEALVQGKDFIDMSPGKMSTRFFTLRAGEDGNGYNPDRMYATLDFVSPGAAKAAGKVILNKIHKDVAWRGQADASDIGLAFERATLIFLSQGSEGMKRLGIRTRCRQLLSQETAGGKCVASTPPATHNEVDFVLNASSDKIEESPNNGAFEAEVCKSGKGVKFTARTTKNSRLKSNKSVVLPPDGYCNVDGMAGSDLGLQSTLQKTHTVSGPEYIRQRQVFGLGPKDPFMLLFVVPPHRFDSGWTATRQFHWTGDDDDASTSRKKRRVKKSGNPVPAKTTSEDDKKSARASIKQFVLTLEIED